MISLNLAQVKKLHQMMVESTGGHSGLRDEGALEAALMNAFATFDGQDLYPGVEAKAAVKCYGIIRNHPFIDGNKRMGIFVMLVFLEANEIRLSFTQDELVQLGLGIAQGNIDAEQIQDWIATHRS